MKIYFYTGADSTHKLRTEYELTKRQEKWLKLTIKSLLLLLPILFFLIVRLLNLSFRFTDSNYYFFLAQEMLKGKVLFKDLFFTNLPLYPLVNMVYVLFADGNLIHYYFIGALETVIAAILIFIIVQNKTGKFLVACFSSVLFLYSFTTQIASITETGIFTAIIFLLLAYWFIFIRKNYLIGGVFLGLCFLTKAWFIPVILPFYLVPLFSHNFNVLRKMVISSLLICSFILLPFIVLSGKQMYTDLFHLIAIRSQLSSYDQRLDIVTSTFQYDFLIVVVFIGAFFYWKKDYFISLVALSFVLFLLIYQNIYPLYMEMIIPLLCIYAFEITSNLTNISTSLFTKPVKQYPLELLFALVTILFGIYTTYYYLHDYAQDSTVPDVSKIVKLIQSEKPDYLFGSVEVTPAFSYLANVPPLGNIADTNDVLFATGVLNKDKLNIKAYTTKTIIISKGVYYPGKIIQPVDASIFDVNILSSCVILGSFPVEGGDFVNRLNIIKCYK